MTISDDLGNPMSTFGIWTFEAFRIVPDGNMTMLVASNDKLTMLLMPDGKMPSDNKMTMLVVSNGEMTTVLMQDGGMTSDGNMTLLVVSDGEMASDGYVTMMVVSNGGITAMFTLDGGKTFTIVSATELVLNRRVWLRDANF